MNVTCPYNQFGENGERKACSNKQQLFLLREAIKPVIRCPAALKAWRDYMAAVPYPVPAYLRIVTRIALRNQKNAQRSSTASPYSRLSPA